MSERSGASRGPFQAAKKLLRRSVLVNEAYFIAKNTIAGLRGGIEHSDFGRSSECTARADYAEEVFDRYLRDAGLAPSGLAGKRVVEIGPGDNLGAAFLFALHGAEVWTLDAFVVTREPGADEATAEALAQRAAFGDRTESPLNVLHTVHTVYGVPLERATDVLADGTFDLVLSNAVLEHVHNLDAALSQLDALLAPGGLQVHAVDLRDHGVFSRAGIHELAFLGVSDLVWRRMGDNIGLPNRRRMSAYRSAMRELGYDATYMVTHILGTPDALRDPLPLSDAVSQTARPRTAKALDSVPARAKRRLEGAPREDWVVQRFVMVARRNETLADGSRAGSGADSPGEHA